jgi:hypothetical protein
MYPLKQNTMNIQRFDKLKPKQSIKWNNLKSSFVPIERTNHKGYPLSIWNQIIHCTNSKNKSQEIPKNHLNNRMEVEQLESKAHKIK